MSLLKRASFLLWELLQELSDESAYRRHLAYHGRRHSPEEWRRFSDQRLQAKYVRPKCC